MSIYKHDGGTNTEFLDMLEEHIIFFKALVYVDDFEVGYCNNPAADLMNIAQEIAQGKRLNSLSSPNTKYLSIHQKHCGFVWETGFEHQQFFLDNTTGKYYKIILKRALEGVLSITSDHTHYSRARLEHQEQAVQFNNIIDASANGTMLLEAIREMNGEVIDFKIAYINKAGFLTGQLSPSSVGKTLLSVFPHLAGSNQFALHKQVLGTGQEARIETTFRTETGQEYGWFIVSLVKHRDGIVSTFIDITDKKKGEQKIKEQSEMLNKVINTAQAGICTLIPEYDSAGEVVDFRFRLVNQSMADFIQHGEENLAGELASTHFPEFKKNGLFDIYKSALTTDYPQQFDFHYQGKEDHYFNIKTIRMGAEVLVTFTNHTDLKKLSMQLETSVTELQQKNANLEEFAYAASHDLQEPLRKIHFFAERLRKLIRQKLSDEEASMFERIENASRRMSSLINDLLSYSHFSRNAGHFRKTNLNEILHQVLGDLETSVDEKSAAITSDSLPVIKGDPVQLRQMFQNLLSNSLKYSDAHTSPVIHISCTTATKTINAVKRDYYQIEITDNGIGFEQAQAEKIFKVFQRLHGQGQYPGTGIGLAIVLKVVQNHNGFITAHSQPAKGSKFTLLLPKS